MAATKERKNVVTYWRVGATWYWQLNGSNGRMLAGCPTAGYTSRRNAENAVDSFAKAMTRKFYTTRVIANNEMQAAA
jgi:uncharacterized protein YegP (UPF0339 family)